MPPSSWPLICCFITAANRTTVCGWPNYPATCSGLYIRPPQYNNCKQLYHRTMAIFFFTILLSACMMNKYTPFATCLPLSFMPFQTILLTPAVVSCVPKSRDHTCLPFIIFVYYISRSGSINVKLLQF